MRRLPTPTWPLLALGATVLGSFIACTDDVTASPAPQPDGGAEAGRDSSAEEETDAGDTVDGDGPDAGQGTGSVYFLSDPKPGDAGLGGAHRAGAYFTTGATSTDIVTETKFGPCVAQKIEPGDGDPGPDVSGGTITIKGGTRTITLEPGSDNIYLPDGSESQALFTGGETMTVSTTGATAPKFSASVVAPSLITVSAPALASDAGAAGPLDIDRSAPLTVTWSGTSSGSVIVYLAIAGGSEARTLTCTYPVSAGTAEIPANALGTLLEGGGSFDIYVQERVAPKVPGWKMSVVASKTTISPDSTPMTGDATFH